MAARNAQMRLKISFKLGGVLASAELCCLLTFLTDGNGDGKKVQGGRRTANPVVCGAGY